MSAAVGQSSENALSPKGAMKRIREQGVRLKYLLIKSAASAGVLLGVWLVGYFRFNVTWVIIPSFVYIGVMEYRKSRKLAAGGQDDEQSLLGRVEELPSWVLFPDVERAEWLNKIIRQMWPYIGKFVKNMLKTTVEPRITELLPSIISPFEFQTIDVGSVPPRVGGVKVYIDNIRRDEVIMDVEIIYASDAHFQVSVRGIPAGIKDVQVTGSVRVIMKPLVNKIPIISKVTVYFLQQPDIEFDLTQMADLLDIPLLSTSLRTIASDEIANRLVFPNKITVPLMDETGLASLLFRMPKGLVQLFVDEAAELKKADIGFGSSGTADPYCKITVGSQPPEQTEQVKNTITPVWNKVYEFLITNETAVNIEVYDHDVNKDDFLGRKMIDFESLKLASSIDEWHNLQGVETGRIKLRAHWKHLNSDPSSLPQAKQENGSGEHLSLAVLLVVVDSAKKLPLRSRQEESDAKSKLEPDPYVRLQLGNRQRETTAKEAATNPTWEEQFEFLCGDPTLQELSVAVVNKHDDQSLGVCKVSLADLLHSADMTSSRPYHLRESGTDTTVTLHLCLRILTSSPSPADDEGPAAVDEVELSATQSQSLSSVPSSTAAAESDDTGLVIESERMAQSAAVDTELRHRRPKATSDGRFGRIQLTIRYSVQRSHLVVVVHQCKNLIPCDSDNLSDPYVRLYLLPDRSSSTKRKTQTHKNSLEPVYDETFEWPVARSDLASHEIELNVKNDKGIFSTGRVHMGQLRLDLSQFDDLTKASTEWYDLEDPDSE